jgi:hypothetical protein
MKGALCLTGVKGEGSRVKTSKVPDASHLLTLNPEQRERYRSQVKGKEVKESKREGLSGTSQCAICSLLPAPS